MRIEAKQRLLADEGQGQTAPAQVIAEELVAAWKRMMPTSTAFARPTALNPSDIRMHGWYIKFKIAGSKEEVANSIWENDMLSLMFMIDPQNDGTFEVECGGTMGSITTKATEKYMAYGREKLRKYVAKGDAAKVTKQATAYLQKVKETISRLVQEDRMPDVPFDWHKKMGLSGHDAKARLLAFGDDSQIEARDALIKDFMEIGGLSQEDAKKLSTFYIHKPYVKLDPKTKRFVPTTTGVMEPSVMRSQLELFKSKIAQQASMGVKAVPSLRKQFEGPEGMLEDADNDGSAVETDSDSE